MASATSLVALRAHVRIHPEARSGVLNPISSCSTVVKPPCNRALHVLQRPLRQLCSSVTPARSAASSRVSPSLAANCLPPEIVIIGTGIGTLGGLRSLVVIVGLEPGRLD